MLSILERKATTKPRDKYFNRFVSGDLSIDDYSKVLNDNNRAGSKSKGRGFKRNLSKTVHAIGQDTVKRLSEFFAGDGHALEQEEKPAAVANGGTKMSLNEILDELKDEPLPDPDSQE